ncbi:usp family [Fusarium heterosporum]|uniref:Usp family n=1 Tax=Fusarium heterosporum TaxID=42747 RepID=A0A8H5SVF4_FUSHE|nr:usp family [Fusarium heterosporum]
MSRDQQPMSIEAMLDMERKEVLALLENRPRPRHEPAMQGAMRAASPYATSRSPVRSMLDVDGQSNPSYPRQAPVRSMLDTTSPPPPRIRSMLDTETPIGGPSRPSGTSTTPNSPVMTKASLAPVNVGHTRSFSDASSNPVEFGPRATTARKNDPTLGYQFSDIITRNTGQQLPKRNTQGGRKSSASAMTEALRNADLSGLQIPGESDRKRSWFGGSSSKKSKSPHNRLNSRSSSPNVTQTLSPGTAMLDDGRIVDISNAYRRLSDANLAYSGGSLSTLAMRNREDSQNGRMIKDYLGPDGEHLGSSDEDEPYSSDDEDRGRKKAPRSLNPDATGQPGGDSNKDRRQSLSLLAAAEEERTIVASKQPKYRSLLDEPEIKVTTPLGENTRLNKGSGIHPKTAYDQMSTVASANDSDEEADMDDIKRAQNLSCSMSNVINTPESHRSIRMIYRGDYTKIAQQAEEEHHRLRKYLVASDLSDESTHALEWAIGTVLRDGDTLMCIYCVDEETGIGGADNQVPDDPKAMREQAAAINTVANSRSAAPSMSAVPDFVRNTIRGDSSKNNTPNTSPAPSSRGERGRAEEERRRAVKEITDKVLRLLRKTTLQVRVIVEVLHCKNPKHLITEVIDLVNPTLVVIGSRGRSALKGVILGSFSNYLVTKSSVPVMVARKRLRKQGKYIGLKPVNNLSNLSARSLANAKID